MKRRQFLLSPAAAAVHGSARAQRPDQARRDRLAVMSYSFTSLIKRAGRPNEPSRTLEIMDLAGLIAERFGIHHVEFQHADFASTEPGYFREFRERMKQARSRMIQINLEFGALNISAPDPVIRLQTIDLTKSWIDHAAALGCPRVMVNQGNLAPEVRPAAIETLRTINAYGRAKKVFVTMEPRNAPWEAVVEVIKAAGIWANPDTGNFPDNESRAAALAVMYKLTSGSSHVKHLPEKFSTEDGVRIAKQAGYKGLFSIEASARSNGPDPYAAVETIANVLIASL